MAKADSGDLAERPYPLDWEEVAELRVFRTTAERWQRLIGWRADMRRKGWKLLQVAAHAGEMVAVFGRTKEELLTRQEAKE
ncbi:MAG: hypothetical protein GTN62_03860 [Gemmatimonadales bacterium]|nr:hypothetical protein [Gemmatimonadales bacterium]NIN49235.1 hypothetical protein [Gemmatimonadales bacterium]NIP06699.1 hypothetical protein [Gemmatimonadales bacterium]NIR00030.1 hypothetical protein [Gemmatimonadales bacterium]NIS64488.1 hypothetical protein [Gemmatimonadales bacterium]